jgi:hypothetical protein
MENGELELAAIGVPGGQDQEPEAKGYSSFHILH